MDNMALQWYCEDQDLPLPVRLQPVRRCYQGRLFGSLRLRAIDWWGSQHSIHWLFVRLRRVCQDPLSLFPFPPCGARQDLILQEHVYAHDSARHSHLAKHLLLELLDLLSYPAIACHFLQRLRQLALLQRRQGRCLQPGADLLDQIAMEGVVLVRRTHKHRQARTKTNSHRASSTSQHGTAALREEPLMWSCGDKKDVCLRVSEKPIWVNTTQGRPQQLFAETGLPSEHYGSEATRLDG
mmetsp:Transcript_120210/g.335385  ORF Transcript_120210/g.335385 Transcript_120210/m.335385 type:complete len:239 (+) Transcript_120210:1494-2210(+)